ncbi:PIN domain-containing protein [Microbacterium sp. LRZ72]|uniref:PIN domain-containing protein n=1 Tax=Microbacterium sp. LRZ72 TaxID=2942481 RepID=UPI0029A9CDAD|nr:PIN domain-containing protein [Microbacterium sp. LRZ72]MDX2377310.1 PIN domain-containing protein [Microbacterium sp. LRZ72]
MRTPVAFVDANILFSRTLCDWLFLLRLETNGGMFVLFSSEDSITETLYNLRRRNPSADGSLTSNRQQLLRRSLDDILDSFSGDVDFPGLDKNDHHVHAAALECHARYLIANDQGFAEIEPDLLPYEAHTADSFLMLIAANAPTAVDAVITRQLRHYADKPASKPLDVALVDAGCPPACQGWVSPPVHSKFASQGVEGSLVQ